MMPAFKVIAKRVMDRAVRDAIANALLVNVCDAYCVKQLYDLTHNCYMDDSVCIYRRLTVVLLFYCFIVFCIKNEK